MNNVKQITKMSVELVYILKTMRMKKKSPRFKFSSVWKAFKVSINLFTFKVAEASRQSNVFIMHIDSSNESITEHYISTMYSNNINRHELINGKEFAKCVFVYFSYCSMSCASQIFHGAVLMILFFH
jgi:hypothetical protein